METGRRQCLEVLLEGLRSSKGVKYKRVQRCNLLEGERLPIALTTDATYTTDDGMAPKGAATAGKATSVIGIQAQPLNPAYPLQLVRAVRSWNARLDHTYQVGVVPPWRRSAMRRDAR
jgi:hypothetical protein